MPNVSLVPGYRYIKDGSIFKIIKRMDNNNIEVEDENTKRCSIFQQTELVNYLFEGKLRFQISDISLTNHNCSIPDFSAIEGKYHDIAVLRHKCIEPLLNLPSKDRTVERVKKRIEKVLSDRSYKGIIKRGKLHRATVYRWLQNFEKSGRDIRSLLPSYDRCGGKNKMRVEKEIEEFIGEGISKVYLNKMRRSIKPVHEYVQKLILDANKFKEEGERLPPVGYNTIRRRIKALGIYDATKQRYGVLEAEKRLGAKGEGLKPIRPLEIAEMDHTKLNIFVVDKTDGFVLGEPWITFLVDKYSRYPLGFHIGFDEHSYLSVMHCLYNSVCPKDYVREKYPQIKNTWTAYGIPETLVVDNGKEFHSVSLEDACRQLNITLQHNPPGKPWFKGTVERSFRTFSESLLGNLPGKSFSSWDKRGGYNPVKEACISFEGLIEIIHIWLIDVYCRDFHRGIKGIPQEFWDNGIEAYPPRLPSRKEDLIILLGALEERTISPKGIEFMGLFYNSRELIYLLSSGTAGKTHRVRFKYNPDDLSLIWVYDEAENRYLEVKAVNQQYTRGLSIWKHRVVVNRTKKVKEKVDAGALLESKAEINRIAERDKKELTRKRKSSARIAKWNNVSSSAAITQNTKNEKNLREIASDAEPSKANSNSAIQEIPDSEILEVLPDLEIIESEQRNLTDKNSCISNGSTEFDLSGWGVSSKVEWQQKEHNKKSADVAATEEGTHGK